MTKNLSILLWVISTVLTADLLSAESKSRRFDVKLNQYDWESLIPEQQNDIERGLKKSGLIKPYSKIIPDLTIPSSLAEPKARNSGKSKQDLLGVHPSDTHCPLKVTACDTAEAAAVAACAGIPPGVWVACINSAHTAANSCRSGC